MTQLSRDASLQFVDHPAGARATVVYNVLRGLFSVGAVCLVAAIFNLVRMAAHIRSDAPKGARNMFALLLDSTDFTDEKGVKYKKQFNLSVLAFIVVCILIGVVIVFIPEQAGT